MLFMLAAVWPDDIKFDHNYMRESKSDTRVSRNIGYADKLVHPTWHYTDQPFSDDGTALIQPPAVNAQERIELFRETLASNASDNVKLYDSVWLEHLIGDVHQPLHAAKRFATAFKSGDGGGNSVLLKKTWRLFGMIFTNFGQ